MGVNRSEPLVVYRSLRKDVAMMAQLVLGLVLFSGLFWWSRLRQSEVDQVLFGIALVVFGLAVVICAIVFLWSLHDILRQVLSNKRDCITLTSEGFSRLHGGREVSSSWAQVKSVRISYEHSRMGIQKHVHLMLGSNALDTLAALKTPRGRADTEIVLDDVYETKVEHLYLLLKRWRRLARGAHTRAVKRRQADE